MIYNQKQKYTHYYLFLLGLLINYAPASFAEINLDKNIQSATIINGIKGGKCITGNCIISGGDKSGANIFHRFNSFDTRGSINSVLFKNENYKNVIVGVSSSKGSFINKPISLSEKGNLFWVSPGGINIGNGADFINTSQLHLSTANSLHFSNGVFDVFSNRKYHLNKMGSNPLIKKEGFKYTPSNPNKISNISLSGINVSIDENLYIDALDGNVAIKDSTIKTSKNSGGEITILGKDIIIEGSSKLISQGEQSGGLIQIGGSWQNSNPYIRQAVYTEIGEDVFINASAKDHGNGGEIVIWSDIKNPLSSTVVSGTFKVDGGALSGDGGRIETSGANLDIKENISVSMGSNYGNPGKWLLDPEDYIVTSSVATLLVNALESGDVEISTTCSPDTYGGCQGSGDGDITIGSDLDYSNNSGQLTLTAASQVIVNSDIDSGSGGLVITAPDGLTGSGQIKINPNSINSTSGDISVSQNTDSTYSGAIAGSPIGSSDFKLYGTGTLSFASTPTNFTKVLQAEYGSLSLTEEWQTVTLNKTYTNAVVIVSDPSNNDTDSVTTRIKNVTSTSFDIRIDEPEAHSGTHSTETASYFVGEAGNYEMSDGTKITLGTVSSNDLISNAHESTFDIGSSLTNPAVFTQVQTTNDSNWVVTRVRSVTSSTFVLGLQEQESFYSDGHAEETVGYLAIEKGSNKSNGSHTIDVGETSNSFTHSIGSQSFGTTFSGTPALIVKMATRDGGDASNVRTTSISDSSFSAYIDEESSRESEQNHTTEALYYLAFLSPSNTSSGTFGFTIADTDTTAPTIINVTATTADGSYKKDDTITITVSLSEAVDVTGTPTLTLNTGNNATYSDGTGSDTLTFTYTVQDGDTTSDLDYNATGSLSGTLKDTALNNATLTLATPGEAGSLAANKALVLDTTAPTITNVTATTADGSYKKDDTITITVTLSEAVDVTGTPKLTLRTGNDATYFSGSGSDTLTFKYRVQDGDSASKLDYATKRSLSGTLKDTALNNAILTLAKPGRLGSLAFGSSISITGVPPNLKIEPPKFTALAPKGPAPRRSGNAGTSSLAIGPSSSGRRESASSGGSSTPSRIRVSAGGNVAPPKSIGGQGVKVSLALDSSQGMGDSSSSATPSSGPSSPSSSEGGGSSSSGGSKSKSSKSGSKNSTSNSGGDGDNSSSSDSGGDSSSSDGTDSNKNKSEPSGEETSSDESSSDESSSDKSSSDESSSDESSSDESSSDESSEEESSETESNDEESSDEESSDKESSSSEKADGKDSKSSRAAGDRNKKDKESRNKIIDQARRIVFTKVPNREVLANLNKFMNRNITNTIDVLNLDKSFNSGTNIIDIQRKLKIAKSKIRNTSSLSRLFYGEKLFASNSQSLRSNKSKIFFEKNLYEPAVMHLRFTKAAGKTTTENTDSFLDITLIPSEDEVIGKRVELSMKEFGKNLGLLYSQLSRQENLNVELESSPSRVLNNMIFESIKPELERLKVTTILISADRGLQAIPYAALHDGENYFGDSYAFSITPSLGLTDISFSDSEDKKLLAIGASEFRELAPLPLVGQELSKIGGTKNKEIIFNKEFTPESFFEKAIQEKYDTIHIATHAEFKPGGPNASRLFSGTTPITLDNFSILRKGRIGNPLDLVVFSACRTALGDPETELGFSGLALQAGAKSAIGTLWYVDDVMTSAYFVQMYKFLDLGIPKAEAMQLTRRLFAQKLITLEDDKLIGFNNLPLLENLNLSQKRLIKNGLNNPFFWAGIELMGSPW